MDSDEEQVSFLEKDSGSRLTRQKSTRNVSMVGAIAPSRPKSNRKTPLNKVPFAYSNPVEKVPGDSNANGMNAIESFLLLTSTQPEDELQSHSGSVKIVEDKYRYAPQRIPGSTVPAPSKRKEPVVKNQTNVKDVSSTLIEKVVSSCNDGENSYNTDFVVSTALRHQVLDRPPHWTQNNIKHAYNSFSNKNPVSNSVKEYMMHDQLDISGRPSKKRRRNKNMSMTSNHMERAPVDAASLLTNGFQLSWLKPKSADYTISSSVVETIDDADAGICSSRVGRNNNLPHAGHSFIDGFSTSSARMMDSPPGSISVGLVSPPSSSGKSGRSIPNEKQSISAAPLTTLVGRYQALSKKIKRDESRLIAMFPRPTLEKNPLDPRMHCKKTFEVEIIRGSPSGGYPVEEAPYMKVWVRLLGIYRNKLDHDSNTRGCDSSATTVTPEMVVENTIDYEYMLCYFKVDTYRAKQLAIGLKVLVYDPVILKPTASHADPTMIATYLCDVMEVM